MPEYTIHYFPFYGRAEPCKLMLSHAKADWTEKVVEFPDWPSIKASMPG